jgi:hypothetical protein
MHNRIEQIQPKSECQKWDFIFARDLNFDELVKSPTTAFNVILAKAGIQ